MGKGKTYSESKKVHGVELWGWLKVAYLALLLSRRVHVSLAKWAEDLVSVELTAWLGPTWVGVFRERKLSEEGVCVKITFHGVLGEV